MPLLQPERMRFKAGGDSSTVTDAPGRRARDSCCVPLPELMLVCPKASAAAEVVAGIPAGPPSSSAAEILRAGCRSSGSPAPLVCLTG